MWKISKSFDFCYGHRVWSQTLNKEYSLDSCLACRHLHGHQGKVIVTLSSNELEAGMVTDFKHLNWFKQWLDDMLDHKFIMDYNDPVLSSLFPLLCYPNGSFDFSKVVVFPDGLIKPDWSLEIQSQKKAVKEIYEGLVLVKFVPTSENLSKWIFDIVKDKMKDLPNVTVHEVEFQETPKSVSLFTKDDNA